MSDKLVIIDGNSIMYRSFYALPLLSNSEGEYSNAIYGFAMQIINIINNINPKYMVVALMLQNILLEMIYMMDIRRLENLCQMNLGLKLHL